MKRILCLTACLLALSATASSGQVSGKTERMARGFGSRFISMDSTSAEVGRVTVRSKSAGFCAVTASFTASIPASSYLDLSLSSSSGTFGPWLQRYANNDASSEYTSGALTQTFDVPADTATKFYLNGSTSGASINVELARIWTVCGVGNSQGLTDGEEDELQEQNLQAPAEQ